jgi:hypothetical protein
MGRPATSPSCSGLPTLCQPTGSSWRRVERQMALGASHIAWWGSRVSYRQMSRVQVPPRPPVLPLVASLTARGGAEAAVAGDEDHRAVAGVDGVGQPGDLDRQKPHLLALDARQLDPRQLDPPAPASAPGVRRRRRPAARCSASSSPCGRSPARARSDGSGRTAAPCPPFGGWVSAARPPNRTCGRAAGGGRRIHRANDRWRHRHLHHPSWPCRDRRGLDFVGAWLMVLGLIVSTVIGTIAALHPRRGPWSSR